MEFDQQSGRTILPENPWADVIYSRLKNASSKPARNATSALAPQRGEPPASPATGANARRAPLPRLPKDNYTVVYRPRSGLNLAAWAPRTLIQSFATACAIPQQEFYNTVVLQIQTSHNLVVASTPNASHAITLSKISSVQIGGAQYELMPYMKPPPDTCRGVIHGLDPDTTTETLADLLEANKPQLIHARLMGRTTSALLTFHGPHVPFYVKVGSLLYRCRPFRRTVQVCQLCGDIGHRQDVCPHPDRPTCLACGLSNPSADHPCNPQCKLCHLPHATASKDCPKRIIPAPPVTKPRPPHSGKTVSPASDVDPRQVSWSAAVSRSPNAHSYPTLPTRPTAPSQTPLPPAPSAIDKLLAEIKQQNAAMIQRIEALEQANRLSQQAPETLPPPEPASPPPPSLSAEPADTLFDEKIRTQVMPLVEKHITNALATLNTTITDTTQTLLRLTDSLTQRMTALEQASQSNLTQAILQRLDALEGDRTPQTKKQKISLHHDAHVAAATPPLPSDDD